MRSGWLLALASGPWMSCAKPESLDTALLPSPGAVDAVMTQTPPSTPTVAIEPFEPLTTDDLRWTFERLPEDRDGDLLSWSVLWAVDGTERLDYGDTVPADATALGQVWEVRVAVTDGVFTTDTALAVTVIGNTPPVASVVITPEAPTTLDRLRATPSGSDVDGDAFGYEILWLVDGSNSGLTGPDVPPDRTRAGESWSVVVTPVQAGEIGEEATATVRIQNSSPTVTELEIEPSDPLTTDTLTLQLEGDDADPNDVLQARYTWTVDGVVVGTESELDARHFVRGQEVGAAVALHDGTVRGPARYAEPVVIGNSEPAITGVVIEPSGPQPSDTVICRPEGWSDADDDPEAYTFAWTLNGDHGPTVDLWDLTTATVAANDVVACAVTPMDGYASGVALVAMETVRDPE
ncbi:MAG TPA: hypothetical protein DFR83_08290 [Deltaproteobacteria bacterium]|nr:hypothetical protein [Deltaproteobacteria bacterium]